MYMFPITIISLILNNLIVINGSPVDDLAANVKSWMDATKNPCDDFYAFSCGNFGTSVTIPGYKTTDADIEHTKIFTNRIKSLMEEPINESEFKPFKMARKYYKACMNEEKVEQIGLDDLKKVLDSLGGFPVISGSQWNERNYSWTEVAYKLRKHGFLPNGFFLTKITKSKQFPKNLTIAIGRPTFQTGLDNLKLGRDNVAVQHYLSNMIKMMQAFGADKKVAENDMKLVMELEIVIAQALMPNAESQNETEVAEVVTIAALEKLYPSIPWLEYIQNMLPDRIQINKNLTVIINEPKYLKKLEGIIFITPKRILANYQIWQPLFYTAKYLLNEHVVKVAMDGFIDSDDNQMPEIRYQECINRLLHNLPPLIGSLYVRKYFDQESKNNIEKLVELVQISFTKHVSEADWIESVTKSKLIKQIKSMKKYIGYQDQYLDDSKFLEMFQSLEIDEDHLMLSELKIYKLIMDYEYGRLNDPIDKIYLSDSIAQTILHYFANSNTLQISAGMLHDRIFDKKNPMFMNFGSVGFLLGRELFRGFIYRNRNYNDWWTKESEEAYKMKTKCIMQDCVEFTNTINNTAKSCNDMVVGSFNGLRDAYRSYKLWVMQNGKENNIPNWDYTADQMFWVSAAQTMCSSQAVEEDPSSAANVIVSMRNTEEFASDWNCPTGTNLNPDIKCAAV